MWVSQNFVNDIPVAHYQFSATIQQLVLYIVYTINAINIVACFKLLFINIAFSLLSFELISLLLIGFHSATQIVTH